MTKLYSLVFASFTALGAQLFAQQQFQNPGFETWENEGTATAEPVNWSSLKTSGGGQASAAPVVITKDTGRNGGSSVKLENKSAFGITANGILTNGRVYAPDFNPENGYVATVSTDDRWNTPFSSRPDSLVGWYKFLPTPGDKGKVEVVLHKGTDCRLPEGATPNDIVAMARFDMVQSAASWTRFSVPFTYLSADTPDYILAVITSGDSTQALVGSLAWFDDFELIYNLPVQTLALSTNLYEITNTTGAAISVSYTVPAGVFSGANEFIAELSDANGNFANPIVLGTLTSASSGVINGEVPAQIQPGTNYRVRVRPTETIAGYTLELIDNGEDVTIDLYGNMATYLSVNYTYPEGDPVELIVYEGMEMDAREWKYALTSGGPYQSFDTPLTTAEVNVLFPDLGNYYVVCESTLGAEVFVTNELLVVMSTVSVPENKKEEFIFSAHQQGERIVLKSNTTIDYVVYDALGKRIRSGSFSGETSMSPRDSGLYFIQYTDGQRVATKKIIYQAYQ
jgi:hypothetical protein